MQCVGQAFSAFSLFPGELHDYIIRVQAGFSCRRIVVDSGNLDALIRCQMKTLSLLLGHVFEIDAKVSAMMMKTAHANHRFRRTRAGRGWQNQQRKAGKTPWKRSMFHSFNSVVRCALAFLSYPIRISASRLTLSGGCLEANQIPLFGTFPDPQDQLARIRWSVRFQLGRMQVALGGTIPWGESPAVL